MIVEINNGQHSVMYFGGLETGDYELTLSVAGVTRVVHDLSKWFLHQKKGGANFLCHTPHLSWSLGTGASLLVAGERRWTLSPREAWWPWSFEKLRPVSQKPL